MITENSQCLTPTSEAVRKTAETHCYLKARFVNDGGDVKLRRCDEETVAVSLTALDRVPDQAFFQSRVQPFDLFHDRLYRFEVYTFGADSWLFADIHHTVYDGLSSGIFMEDLNKALSGETPEAESLTAYDYALYEKEILDGELLKKADERFDALLTGAACASIPADGHPDGVPYGTVKLMVPAAGIDDLCARLEVTPGSFMQAAFAETVRRICRENKAVYTTVSNGRSADPALLDCVGMFVRTIPVVTMDPAAMTAEAYIRAVHAQLQESFSMEFYPYTRVVERHRLKAELMFVYQGGIEEGGEEHSEREIHHRILH